MKASSVLVAASALFLSACWGGPSADDGSSSSASASGSLSASSKVAAHSSTPSFVGEFAQQPDGSYLGAVTLTGYVTTRTVDEPFCTQNCKTYKYVLFNVTDGLTPGLKQFLDQNAGNAYAGDNAIGIGCVSDDGKAIVSQVADPKTYMAERRIDAADSAVILKSNPRNLVTVTLNRDYEPAGGEAPACYSHFEYVMVTD